MAKKLIRQARAFNWLRIVHASATPEICVHWIGWLDKEGYGQAHWIVDGKARQLRMHRVSLALRTGSDEPELFCLHSCHNPSCINPHHLRWGTHPENMNDRNHANRCRKTRVPIKHIQALVNLSGKPLKDYAAKIGISWTQAYELRRQHAAK